MISNAMLYIRSLTIPGWTTQYSPSSSPSRLKRVDHELFECCCCCFFPYLHEGIFIEFSPPANGEYELIIKCAVFIFHGMPNILSCFWPDESHRWNRSVLILRYIFGPGLEKACSREVHGNYLCPVFVWSTRDGNRSISMPYLLFYTWFMKYQRKRKASTEIHRRPIPNSRRI